jgi:hypothetical protein
VAGLVVLDQNRGQDRGQRVARLGGGGAGPVPSLVPRGRGVQPLAGGTTLSGPADNLGRTVGKDENDGHEKDGDDGDYQNHVHAHQVSVDRSDRVTTSCDPEMGMIVLLMLPAVGA